ncbi:MAG: hypothetical protein RL223_3776, partial [Pseudomonadota bacterium]
AALIKQAGKHPTFQCELFVGGRRVHEREAAAERLTTLGFVAGSADVAPVPAVVVATAAGEVGVDLDASDAVADIVAWERIPIPLKRWRLAMPPAWRCWNVCRVPWMLLWMEVPLLLWR